MTDSVTFTIGISGSDPGFGTIVAIRVKDITRGIWYSWDGEWTNAGGGGENAPPGESPACVNGGDLEISAYVMNLTTMTREVGAALFYDGTKKISKGETVPSGGGVGLTANLTMLETGNVHVLLTGEATFPVEANVEFDIAGIGESDGEDKFVLTVASSLGGTTSPPPSQYHLNQGLTANISARPDNGYHLDHWELDANPNAGASSLIRVPIDNNHTVTAVFAEGSEEGGNNLLLLAAAAIGIGVGAPIIYYITKKPKKD